MFFQIVYGFERLTKIHSKSKRSDGIVGYSVQEMYSSQQCDEFENAFTHPHQL